MLIGVLEYAKIFFNNERPFETFLQKIGELLTDNGKVLVAIENRYGIKYWSGANEDHLGKPYIGLEGYDNQSVQTFGKQELIDLIEKCGFTKYKFYYPFPDYKLPSVIYSDDRFPKYDEVFNIPIFTYGNTINFDIHKVLHGLLNNCQFGFFSNSFLIEFGKDRATISNIIYAKNSLIRNDKYQIMTLQDSEGNYYKAPCSSVSADHLNNIVIIHQKMNELNINNSKIENFNNVYKIENVNGVNESEYFSKLLADHKIDDILSEFDNLVDFYRSISVKKKINKPIMNGLRDIYKDSTYLLKLSLIDGNISNLIRTENGKYVFIDQEWIDENELPADYLILMSILYIFRANENILNYYRIDDILNRYEITKEKSKALLDVEKYFYYSKNNVININKNKKNDSLKILKNKIQLETHCAVYYDIGNGFNEDDKIIGTYIVAPDTNNYRVKFNLPPNVNLVRFDPLLVGGKLFYFDNFMMNGAKVKYDNWNIYKHKDMSILINEHPYITFTTDERNIEITLNLYKLPEEEMENIMTEILKNNC